MFSAPLYESGNRDAGLILGNWGISETCIREKPLLQGQWAEMLRMDDVKRAKLQAPAPCDRLTARVICLSGTLKSWQRCPPSHPLARELLKVPACRGVARHLADVMTQQSWEARAFGVRAAALLALRFPTEEVRLPGGGGHKVSVMRFLFDPRQQARSCTMLRNRGEKQSLAKCPHSRSKLKSVCGACMH